MKSHKDYLLLSLVIISQIHVLFRGSGVNVDWFVFINKERGLNFTIFMICVFVRFIIVHYCLLFPFKINKDIKTYLFILAILDIFHFFLTSGIGFEIEKIIIGAFLMCLTKFIRYVKFSHSII